MRPVDAPLRGFRFHLVLQLSHRFESVLRCRPIVIEQQRNVQFKPRDADGHDFAVGLDHLAEHDQRVIRIRQLKRMAFVQLVDTR